MNNLVLTDLIIGRTPDMPLNVRINQTFYAGEMYYVSGANGSGKTTFMRTLCGYLQPLAGHISVKNLSTLTAYYGHDNALKHKMLVCDYLNFCQQIFDSVSSLDSLMTLFELKALLDIPISYLSCGQKRRVSLVAFLICNRDIYCFDEASSGLDSYFKAIFYDYITDLAAKKHKIIIFSDHVNPKLPTQKHIALQNFQNANATQKEKNNA